MILHPRRSVLYMPGANARTLEKARSLPADCLILDLEDAVAPERKAVARERIASAVTHGGYGSRELIVRVNGFDTPWGADDIAAMATLPVDAILFPKVDSPEDVVEAVAALDAAGARSDMPVWIMAETARCILRIDAIAAAHERLAAIVLGTADLAKETRIRDAPGRLGFLAASSLCVLAARANGQDVLDGVHFDLDDEDGLSASCVQGRDLGFDGKTLIHPKQLAAANAAFSPSADEVDRASQIVAAWGEARAEGLGVVVVNGRLVEQLHVHEAERTLALAKAVAAADG